MIQATINNSQKIKVRQEKGVTYVNEKAFSGDLIRLTDSSFKVFSSNKIFSVEIIKSEHKEIKLKVNGQLLDVKTFDHVDEILDQLGIDASVNQVVKDVKAPMPGSILNVLIKKGDEVKEGDPLLILEAMKMENMLKSPGEGKVQKIHITEKENVEKNQVLISFE